MSVVDRLAEARIRTAYENGVFDDLPGAGRPLPPDDALQVPAELRAGYRLLKNAGYVPPEVARALDIHALRDLLATFDPHSAEASAATKRLRWLELTLGGSSRGRGLLGHSRYGLRVGQSLASNAR